MEKRGEYKILNLIFLFIAIVIGFVFVLYALNNLKGTQQANDTFYNITEIGIEKFNMFPKFFLAISLILVAIMIFWAISHITKYSGGMGV